MSIQEYEMIIGLEVHVELKTKTKIKKQTIAKKLERI